MVAENGQHENAESFYYLDMCCRQVAGKFGRPSIHEWKNGDYIRLSSILSQHTDVHISPNTLKRIFGKLKTTDRYYPQKATRDALARYAGYEDWNVFVQKHPRPIIKPVEKNEETTVLKQETNIRKKWLLPIAVLVVIVIVVGVLFQFGVDEQTIVVQPGDAELTCTNPEGGNPHSAVFKLELRPSFRGNPENFMIRFADGPQEKKMTPGVLLTHYYEVPGRYYAVLEYNDKDIDTVPVYLKTNGWTATARIAGDTVRVYPINTDDLSKNGKLHVTANEVFHSGVDTNRTFYIDFVNTQPLNISGDNFELEASVTTSSQRPGVRCSQVNAVIFGEGTQHALFLIKPGCESWITLQFAEVYKGGHTNDLSSLGADFSGGGNFKLKVVNKKAGVWIGNRKVYEVPYTHALGKIYGVKITFSGIGSVNDLSIKDLATGELFKKD